MNPGLCAKWFHRSRLAEFIAVAGVMATGLVLFCSPLGGGLTRFSYDLPFGSRSPLLADEIRMVYLDDPSQADATGELLVRQPSGDPPDHGNDVPSGNWQSWPKAVEKLRFSPRKYLPVGPDARVRR